MNLILYIFLLINAFVSVTDDEGQTPNLPFISIHTIDQALPTSEAIPTPDGCWGQSSINRTTVYGQMQYFAPDSTLLYDSGVYQEDISGLYLRIRGNGSSTTPKKPYKIKLQKKADLMLRNDSRYKDKDWALMREGNWTAQRSPIQMLIGTMVGKQMNMAWVQEIQYLDLYLNDQFYGMYMLVETVKRDPKSRIDVDEAAGFVAELDAYWWNEDFSIETSIYTPYRCPLKYTFKYPKEEDFTPAKADSIQNYLLTMESTLAEQDYTCYIDVESWARWYLAQQILGQDDAAGSNPYMICHNLNGDSLLKMPVIWDFDYVGVHSDTWSSINNFHYFKTLLNDSYNRAFNRAVVDIYNSESETIFNKIDSALVSYLNDTIFCNAMQRSIDTDRIRWQNHYGFADIATTLTFYRNYFSARKVWLDTHIQDIITEDDPRYNVHTQIANTNGICKKQYFNIMGLPCSKPSVGIYLEMENDGTFTKKIKP